MPHVTGQVAIDADESAPVVDGQTCGPARTGYARVNVRCWKGDVWLGAHEDVTDEAGYKMKANQETSIDVCPGDEVWVYAKKNGREVHYMIHFPPGTEVP